MYHVTRRLLPAIGAALLVLALAGNAYAADKYVALGDSYSAGNGANSKNLNSSCNRNTYAYPYLVSQQRPNTALTFVACAGAPDGRHPQQPGQLGHVRHEDRHDDDRRQRHRLHQPDHRLHDARLSEPDQQLQQPDRQPAAGEARTRPTRRSRAARRPPRSSSSATAARSRTARASSAFGVSLSEEDQLNALTDNLNNTIKARAQAAGFTYADPNPAWTGHDVCSSNPFTNGLTLTHTADSYHPTRNGYASGYTPLVRSYVG